MMRPNPRLQTLAISAPALLAVRLIVPYNYQPAGSVARFQPGIANTLVDMGKARHLTDAELDALAAEEAAARQQRQPDPFEDSGSDSEDSDADEEENAAVNQDAEPAPVLVTRDIPGPTDPRRAPKPRSSSASSTARKKQE